MESQFDLYHLWKGLKAKCWIYLIAKKALFLFNWINASHKMWSKWCQIGGYSIRLCLASNFWSFPCTGLSLKGLSWCITSAAKTQTWLLPMHPQEIMWKWKIQQKMLFYHLTPWQEVQQPRVMLPMRRRIGSAPLRQPLVPEKNKSIYSTVSLAGKAMRNITGTAWLQKYCEPQTPAYEPYPHQLGYSIFPISHGFLFSDHHDPHRIFSQSHDLPDSQYEFEAS